MQFLKMKPKFTRILGGEFKKVSLVLPPHVPHAWLSMAVPPAAPPPRGGGESRPLDPAAAAPRNRLCVRSANRIEYSLSICVRVSVPGDLSGWVDLELTFTCISDFFVSQHNCFQGLSHG